METHVPPQLFERMYNFAVRVVGERRQDSLAEDCVQDVIFDLLAEGYGFGSWPAAAEIRARLARRAARGRQRTRRRRTKEREAARDHGRRPVRTGRSTPLLCPGLAGLAAFHPDPRRFLETLLAAARWVAHEPRVLQRRQLRAFALGYEARRPAAMLKALLKAPTLQATVERLRRVSGRVECTLVRRVGLVLSPVVRRRLADWLEIAKTVRAEEETEKAVTSSLERLSERLEEALQALLEP